MNPPGSYAAVSPISSAFSAEPSAPRGNETAVYTVRITWLRCLITILLPYRDQDLTWFAAWAPYLEALNYPAGSALGLLFAAAIDEAGSTGEAVFDVLMASARGQHPIGRMGRHVVTGLLVAARPEGWTCIEHLLLAAQREEGLRQIILETIDEAHPQAFGRMLQLVLDHDLIRFSATVRAVDVWFGFGWTVEDTRSVRSSIGTLLTLLADSGKQQEAIAHGHPQQAYFALWASAFENASSAISAATPLLNDALPERRLVATHLLCQLNLPEAQETLLSLLADPDLRVALLAFSGLARTAGYPDPIRLQWAMEAQFAADLRNGALTVVERDIRVTLALTAGTAEPYLTVVKGDMKVLKALPAKLKKQAQIAALLARKREVEQQRSRMRSSLEGAMYRGDYFTASELFALLTHPVLSHLLQSLIFVRAETGHVLGYPLCCDDGAGQELLFRNYSGDTTPVERTASDLRLAHPYDLLASGVWHEWQHECFTFRRIQPFKQVFRELYIRSLHESRHGDETLSWRYSGHQVQPRQALALLGQRGWIADDETGVRRTFHAEGLAATVSFAQGIFTPAEIEGQEVETICFTKRGEWKPIPLADVPPRVFSEVMRDLDLVVSVAHSGGVDPEATTSTIEMRTALIQETCMLLGLTNVELKSAHALIAGTFGNYTVHLGSAVVHRQPGGALCIIPVHTQHRGRLFLPFADDDPKTAEVVSKIVTLARDKELKDPSILEQLL